MKKLLLFLCFVCAMRFVSAQEHLDLCKGTIFELISVDSTDTVVYFKSFTDSISYNSNRIYDTVVGGALTFPVDTDMIYEIVSINGNPYPYITTFIITVLSPPTISIDSIHHVTCPDGDFYPYRDGSFHVSLDDSVQNYAWIKVEVDTPFFFIHTSYDSVTLTNLRSGTYHVIAHGTNGCDYHDSVTIEQPEAWYVDYNIKSVDTVCFGQTGCIVSGDFGGTPPYNFTWFYYTDTGQVFLPDTTRMACNLYSGQLYCYYLYDSKGCKAWGDEIEYVLWYLYEWVEDSIQILTVNPTVCYGSDTIIEAQSVGYGHYVWHVGDIEDTLNYSTWVPSDSVLIAGYFTPPIIGPTLVSVDFYDQHNCVTHDSVWIEVYDPDVSLTVDASEIFADSAFVVYVSPPGGDLYIDDALLISSIPSVFTVYTDGISVGPHILKYAGTFGGSMGLACEDEESIPIQVETNPFVPDWEYNVSIYPNPATTTLNLSSTGISDFELSILDITGKVIKTERMLDHSFTFDVSDLASGMYMLRLVSTDGASKVVKFVKR